MGATEDPRRIFNADESGFLLGECVSRVVAAKGSKKVYKVCFMIYSYIYIYDISNV